MQNESTPDTKPRQRRSQRFFHKAPLDFVGQLTETEWRLVRETTDWARLGQLAQFWNKVDRSAGEDGCWLWTAANVAGRGMVKFGGKNVMAPRVAYEMAHGPIAPDLLVLHACDNPPCVNPRHLFVGTNQDNTDDKMRKKRHRFGETSGNAKLTEVQVRAIYRRYHHGPATQGQLSHEYRVGRYAIYRIVKGIGWRHLNLCKGAHPSKAEQ